VVSHLNLKHGRSGRSCEGTWLPRQSCDHSCDCHFKKWQK